MAGRRSSISRLPPEIRDQINRLIRDGAMIDEIVAHLKTLDMQVSRSAVGRYRKSAEDAMREYREAQEIAGVWLQRYKEDPHGDVGRLVAELLKTVAFTTTARLREAGDGAVDTLDISRLSRAMQALERAGKISLDHVLAIRRETAETAAEAAVSAAEAESEKVGHRLPAEALRAIREQVYGIVEASP